jgi:hypothetical protein
MNWGKRAVVRGEDGLIRWSEEALDVLSDSTQNVEGRILLCGDVLVERGFSSLGGGVHILGESVIVKVSEEGVVVNDLKRGVTVMEFGLEDREGWSGLWESIRLAWTSAG